MQATNDETALIGEGETLGVIGAGVMGRTLLTGLFDSGILPRERAWASASSERTCESASRQLGIPVTPDFKALVPSAGLILICVKPKQVARVIASLKESGMRPETLLVSILAGVTIEQMESALSTRNPLIRAMPNTPCIVRQGITVICPGTRATAEHMARATRIFEAVGRCLPAEETYFNAVTALSGSGPAYQYLIIEALADAGVRVGLPRDFALTLAAQTAVGSARMVLETGRHPAALRDDVTTPAGCTIAGLLMLEDGKIRSVLARAVEEATRTAASLGSAVARAVIPGTMRS